jgi:hypothetical protein
MRSRSWVNWLFWLFWLVWATSFGVAMWWTWPEIKEARLSLLVAVTAFWLNFYPRFIQGSRLVCTANQITILSITTGNQLPLLTEIAIKDLLSTDPSVPARNLTQSVAGIKTAVAAKSVEQLAAWFRNNPPKASIYAPSDDLIIPILKDKRATPSFYVPLIVHNSGAKHAEISSVIMIMELTTDRKQRWAYAALMEVDEQKILSVHKNVPDIELFSALFTGRVVAPGDDVRLPLHFTPHHDADGKQLTTTSLAPGTYDVRITGFDARSRQVCRTVINGYPLEQSTLLMSFKNGQWTYYTGTEQNVLKAFEQ